MTTTTPTILLVDDELAHLKTLEKLFLREGYEVHTANDGQEALDCIRQRAFNLVITDLMMPHVDGMELMQLVRTLQPEADVILMTAFGTVERAVQGMKDGAYDFIAKPIKRNAILKSARLALERQALLAENRELRAQIESFKRSEHNIVGHSIVLGEVLDMARQVSRSDATVLIEGDSGTGKELFARYIYRLSDRHKQPFVALHCAALPESILESELFGYEKGAFTGAKQRKLGRFEAADKGTLFLDEIGEMSKSTQVKLLRVLQEGTFERLGSNTPTKVDVRIIAATNRDLEEEMAQGNFRSDLFYRLNVIRLSIPPLSKRKEDIPLLAEHFLNKYREKNGREIQNLSPEAIKTLCHYSWPGNVRELEHVIERAVVLDRDGVLDLDDLPEQICGQTTEARALTIPLGTSLEEIERLVLLETLKLTGGNKKLAAKLLGIATRTIYRKL